jgi:N-acetylglucosaminyldiphosphoundecaprenol N-acetyl-beta-D-mannosaminyltransferase
MPIVDNDNLSRNVFGLLGVVLDAVDFPTLLRTVDSAVQQDAPFLISTPNVNFLIKSHTNKEFRESVLRSDYCLADGMPLIWIAKLLRIPINERIAGSDLFGRLRSTVGKARRLKIFLIGGGEGVAETVARKLNSEGGGLECVGVLNPGFGTVEEMSTKPILDLINSADPDLIAVFFGAEKAQAWLMHNHYNLDAPVRAQFGATINFEAGIVKRAPPYMRSTGFEWLWRIKEEPYLWRRYWNDGRALLKLMVTCVLPLVLDTLRKRREPERLVVGRKEGADHCVVSLSGDALGVYVKAAILHFREALGTRKHIVVDLSKTRAIDARFFGLFLMARKELVSCGNQLRFTGVSAATRRLFQLNKFEFLLSHDCGMTQA